MGMILTGKLAIYNVDLPTAEPSRVSIFNETSFFQCNCTIYFNWELNFTKVFIHSVGSAREANGNCYSIDMIILQ